MPDWNIILPTIAVLAVVGLLLWRILGSTPSRRASDDPYVEGLEAWVEGRLALAEELLRQAVKTAPEAVEPYLQLGNLLRETDRPAKAAAMHRTLTVRPDLDRDQRVRTGLALADDLLAQDLPTDAGQVLDTLIRGADHRAAYWRLRFRQWVALEDDREAARALKYAADHVAPEQRGEFLSGHQFFLLDRAFAAALAGDRHVAEGHLKHIGRDGPAAPWLPLVRAVLLVQRDRVQEALDLVTAELTGLPGALVAFQAFVRPILLEKNLFDRWVPLLRRVVTGPEAPVPLVIELAHLLEKTGRRHEALTLLEMNRDRADMTPDAAAPLLGPVIREEGGPALVKVWETLTPAPVTSRFVCPDCGHESRRIAWFCPACLHCGPLEFSSFACRGES